MQIIDSQVHIWAPETRERPWDRVDAAKPHRPEPLGHEELLREMDEVLESWELKVATVDI